MKGGLSFAFVVLIVRLIGNYAQNQDVPRTKVTRNRQVTIPAEIASVSHIKEGDLLEVGRSEHIGKAVSRNVYLRRPPPLGALA